MKILKKILIVIVALVAIVLIIAIFPKKEYTVGRDVVINKPKQQVFDYIKMLRNQDNFSKWAKMDPGMQKSYNGTDGTVGFLSAWDSEKVGKGEQQITNIRDGERIDFALHFIKPMEGKADAHMTTETVSEQQTKVNWVINGKMNYPMNILLLFMDMDKILGKDLNEGLVNLKTVVEKQ
jgi:hypothetical protein